MAALFGRVDESQEDKEDWAQYVERLQHFKWSSVVGHGAQRLQTAEEPRVAR